MNVSPDHQKSRQSLQIFSAVPKNRIAENCQKSDVLQKTNETSYQHWLKQVCFASKIKCFKKLDDIYAT